MRRGLRTPGAGSIDYEKGSLRLFALGRRISRKALLWRRANLSSRRTRRVALGVARRGANPQRLALR